MGTHWIYTIRDLYNYDSSLFDNLLVPTGIDKSKLIRKILKESDKFKLIDLLCSPDFFKDQIEEVSETYAKKWQKLYNVYILEYNPIHNYNMNESEKYKSTSTNEDTSIGSVTTYDDDTFHDANKSESDGESNTSSERTFTRSGNIGVTTSQQMAQSEISLWSNFNIYNEIVKDVISQVCRMVYI